MYIEHKKKTMPITYLFYNDEKIFAYFTLSINANVLYIEDIHILKEYRNNSYVISKILESITNEYVINRDKISKVVYYINKKNELSKHNFAKFAKSVEEKKNSYMYELNLSHHFIQKIIHRYK